MKVSTHALLAIIVIASAVIMCLVGAWQGDFILSALGLILFVAGFLYGYRIVYGLPEVPDEESPDADSR